MSKVEDMVLQIETLDLSGPPKLFVMTLPDGTKQDVMKSCAETLGMLNLHEFGHRGVIVANGVELSELSDLLLRNMGLMRIIDAQPARPGAKPS